MTQDDIRLRAEIRGLGILQLHPDLYAVQVLRRLGFDAELNGNWKAIWTVRALYHAAAHIQCHVPRPASSIPEDFVL